MSPATDQSSLSLVGLHAIVTRPQGQETELCDALLAHGAVVSHVPVVDIQPLPLSDSDIFNLQALSEFDWVILTSSNGVRIFFEHIKELHITLPPQSPPALACIGPKTAEVLRSYWRSPDFVPDEYRAECIIQGLGTSLTGKRILLARAQQARKNLAVDLNALGAEVKEIQLYSIERLTDIETVKSVAASLQPANPNKRRAVVLTSGEIARSFLTLLERGGLQDEITSLDFICIGPITAQALEEQRIKPTLIAKDYTAQGLVDVMCAYYG
jgi:uroporphyrinogen III methyltransferase/synthase